MKVEDVVIEELPRVTFDSLHLLPSQPGIYFALGRQSDLLYIGKASNLRHRWTNHHKYNELVAFDCSSVAYLIISEGRNYLESDLIRKYIPELNGRRKNGSIVAPVQQDTRPIEDEKDLTKFLEKVHCKFSPYYG